MNCFLFFAVKYFFINHAFRAILWCYLHRYRAWIQVILVRRTLRPNRFLPRHFRSGSRKSVTNSRAKPQQTPCSSTKGGLLRYILNTYSIHKVSSLKFLHITSTQYAANMLHKWQMKFNVDKCHSMRVTQHLPSNQIHFNFSLHQQTLAQVRSAKYLGLTITDKLEWGQHVFFLSLYTDIRPRGHSRQVR